MPPLVPVRPHVRSWPRSARRREPHFDFLAALAEESDGAERDELAVRLREADRRARDASTEQARRAAADEALRLRRERVTALVETAAWQSPAQLALGVESYTKTAELPAGQLDELAAAVSAVITREECSDG